MASGRLRIGHGSAANRTLTAEYGQFALTGQAAALDYSGSGGDEFFQMDYSSGAATGGGWNGEEINSGVTGIINVESDNLSSGRYVLTRMPTGGPSGQPSYRSEVTGNAYIGQFSYAWHGFPFNGAQIGPGEEVFYRFRFKPVTSRAATSKILMQNTEDNFGSSRVGITVHQGAGGGYRWRGSHGGDEICITPEYSDWGSWSNIQLSLTFAQVGLPFTGIVKIWRNNNVYASPTASALDTTEYGTKAVLDGISNYYVTFNQSTYDPSNGVQYIHETTDFEIGPTFKAM